jgi:CHAT domain-containing protein
VSTISGEGQFGQGIIKYLQGDYLDSEKYVQRAIDICEQDGIEIVNQVYYETLGYCLQQQDKNDEAMIYFQKSLEITNLKRNSLNLDSDKRFHDSLNQDYLENIIISYIKSNQPDETFDYIEKSKAHAFLDLVGNIKQPRLVKRNKRELNFDLHKHKIIKMVIGFIFFPGQLLKYGPDLKPEFMSEIAIETTNIRKIQQSLNASQTIIEYYYAYGNLIIWVITAKSARSIFLEINIQELYDLVEGFRNNLKFLGSIDKLCNRLYNLLLEPLIELITTGEITFVLHGVLHYFPMQTCLDNEGNYLIEKFVIKYLPSSSVIPFFKNHLDRDRKLLGICNPNADLRGLNNLSYATEEIDRIRVNEQNMTLLKGDLKKTNFVEMAEEFNYIHFICHSDLDKLSPMESSLILENSLDESDQLTLSEITSLKLKANLVVLSACETGIGELTGGDEVVCLSRAFLHAGAASVIYSLWQVNDESTAFLMGRFYKYLKKNKTSEALRLAQLDTKEKYDHVFHWAPFVYTGLD